MKVEIINPKFTSVGNGLVIGVDINEVQLVRIIEKVLLSKSIIAEEVSVVK